MSRILLIALILGSFFAQGSWALQPAVSTLVDDETLHNAAELGSNAPIEIENFEIPLNLVDSDITQRLPKEVLESLVFKTPKGEKILRWPINPGDKTYYKRVEDYLKKMHVSTERHRYFTGYRTASKSLILEDPKSGAQFSIKVSTDSASGLWKDKQQTIAESKDARLVADYIDEIAANKKFKNVVVLDEPAMFSLAILIRRLL
ncbi:unnamed protein product [Sphagnum jensenii]|uniref:Uncharacterized protein n=1 Tax=Sphagnum jensenii TaxID=128206 RepID=A0ABP0V7H8_9BRYO